MAPPTPAQISRLFAPLAIQGRQPETLALLADDVDWTIPGHSPMSGRYTTKQDFIDNTLKVLRERVLTEPLRLAVRNVVVSGAAAGAEGTDEEIEGDVVVELEALDAKCKNGLLYDMRYCWVCKFARGKIVQVRAYLDTELLTRVMEQNP
ncbi:uncharacterized protein PV07_08130 [Cladophialophora immunda]|uniref:SnoaL-like domain-containing protein n=1 Tax=Cladophialophora immunda TaxID=569365 RepID=A0A0D2CBP1_9EURO|nr:uncharacterized protein PV07_08130 [Cladophialophora immunda]KIW28468.1 hypothetical protein PV07_08130 [Cladophialophora immunda]OQU95052.1 hypothetical protein CLAIMM_01318 [Cladophialophora immunda]